jgi:hypothetical protein
MRRKCILLFVILFTALTLGAFQNCSRIDFSAMQVNNESSKSNNNGTGYGGKPSGDFYRFHPDFTCENKASPVSELHVTSTETIFVENRQLQCGAVKQNLDPNSIDVSVFQSDVVGYKEGIFESESATPQSIPANLVEVWCRTTKDISGIETITHFNRKTAQADTEIYYTAANNTVKQTLVVSRVASMNTVTVQDGNGLVIEVYRDKPALEFGLFQGSMKAVISGKNLSLPVSCRLGGSFDSKIWPALQIVDNNVQKFQVAPDFSFFGYTSAVGTAPSRLFSADTVGTNHLKVGPAMLLAGVKNFEIAPDAKSFVYWGDPRYPGGIELFKINRNGTGQFQLNELLTNSSQGQESDIRFSADGSRVFYRDGQQETGPEGGADIEMWLRSVPISGGVPTVINPPLPLSGDVGVYKFGISKSQNKVAYLAGKTTAELFIADLDGKNTVKPTITYPSTGNAFEWYADVDVPAPGDYVFIMSRPMLASGSLSFVINAVAFDGSGSLPLPQNWSLKSVSPSGKNAVIYDAQNAVVLNGKNFFKTKLMNLQTGALTDLASWDKPVFSMDSSSLLGVKADSNGALQTTIFSLSLRTEAMLCPSASGSEISIKEVSSNVFLISSYDATKKILSFFLRTADGACLKKNSIPVANSSVSEMSISPDQKKLLVKASLLIDGKAHDQIYYIPLSGEAPLAVNTAVYVGAKVSSLQFLKDSQSILYLGDQLSPGENGVFLWRAP